MVKLHVLSGMKTTTVSGDQGLVRADQVQIQRSHPTLAQLQQLLSPAMQKAESQKGAYASENDLAEL